MVTLVVEDGTGRADANTYASLADASAHHAALGRTKWAEAARARTTVRLRALPTNGDTLVLNGLTAYTFKTTLAAAGDVKIGADIKETAANLVAAITYGADPTNRFHANTLASTLVTADAAEDANAWSWTVTLYDLGDGSEPITASMTAANANNSVSESPLRVPDAVKAALVKATRYVDAKYGPLCLGERADVDQALEWPRTNAEYVDDGVEIDKDVVPAEWRAACCETALRILDGDLDAPVEPGDSGRTTSESVSVGPLSLSTSYSGGGLSTSVTLPAVAGLLRRLVGNGHEVYRA